MGKQSLYEWCVANNDLNLLEEWDYYKNVDITPKDISRGSKTKVAWKCNNGHSWMAPVQERTGRMHTGCPFCSGRRILEGYNDLKTKYPEIASQWNYEKNEHLLPTQIACQSNKKVWWKCEKGHEWQCRVSDRTKKQYECPYCSNKRVLKGYNDLATTHPQIVVEWDYDKNELQPTQVTAGSKQKVAWKCMKCGNEWNAVIHSRTGLGYGCPICGKELARKGIVNHHIGRIGTLKSKNHILLKQWNYEKNTDINPDEIPITSHKKVWWKCEKGHEWQSTLDRRIRAGNGCPYCSNKLVLKGFNDLATTHPEIAAEWDYDKNELQPTQVTAGSNKMIWWKCVRGHEWKSQPNTRTFGREKGCPICSKYLHTSLPEKIIFFYLSKHYEIVWLNYRPSWLGGKEIDLYIPSEKVAIEYDGQLWHKDIKKDIEKNNILFLNDINVIRIREPECENIKDKAFYIKVEKIDSNYVYMESVLHELEKYLKINLDVNVARDMKCFLDLMDKNNKIEGLDEDLRVEWNYEKNGSLLPIHVTKGSHKKVWWKCKKGHEWQANIKNTLNGHGCPYCAGSKVLKGYNDLTTTHPELAKEWDYERNIFMPYEISKGSIKKVWWKCKRGHSWNASVNTRTNNKSQCPYCSNKKVLKGYNDLATTHPEIAEEWNYEKNSILPTEVTAGSEKVVWWKCKYCNYEWKTVIKYRKRGTKCINCAGKEFDK